MSNASKSTYYPSKLATLIQLANLALIIKKVKLTFPKNKNGKSRKPAEISRRFSWSLQTALLLNALKELGCTNVQEIYHQIVKEYYDNNELNSATRKKIDFVTDSFDHNFNQIITNFSNIVQKLYPNVSLSVTKDKQALTDKQKKEIEALLKIAIAINLRTVAIHYDNNGNMTDDMRNLKEITIAIQIRVLTQYLGINQDTIFSELKASETKEQYKFFSELELKLKSLNAMLNMALTNAKDLNAVMRHIKELLSNVVLD